MPRFHGFCVCLTGYTFINKNFKFFNIYQNMKKYLAKIQKILKLTFYCNFKTLGAVSNSKFGLNQNTLSWANYSLCEILGLCYSRAAFWSDSLIVCTLLCESNKDPELREREICPIEQYFDSSRIFNCLQLIGFSC